MSELFWPGDSRAADLFTDAAFVAAMVRVEEAWAGTELVVPDVRLDAEPGGNAVIQLVAALSEANPVVDVHSGLTSQDVVDTAVVLMLRDAVQEVRRHLAAALGALDHLAESHGVTPMVGRTLTQWALPITFGDKVSSWRRGFADADDDLAGLVYPVQCGGPVGTTRDGRLAARLGLADVPAWHTDRRPLTRAADALTATTDACGRVARDVLELSRPEIGELSESTGGGSSSMPHKANPVLSVLVRRAALTAPHLLANLHLCAADQVDERADGAWHAEWDTLRLLVRRTTVATSQVADLLSGLRVHEDRMAANLAAAEAAR
ncbi:lyase family protein [Nocardioides sp.]|uniref:lyase family protein n=1 Tax=Nocardioides sp. TaxID=35761 RepID=UPI002625E366|nr:lyase family protein [Nocardioides sp.]